MFMSCSKPGEKSPFTADRPIEAFGGDQPHPSAGPITDSETDWHARQVTGLAANVTEHERG
jgi:hypothetical protein